MAGSAVLFDRLLKCEKNTVRVVMFLKQNVYQKKLTENFARFPEDGKRQSKSSQVIFLFVKLCTVSPEPEYVLDIGEFLFRSASLSCGQIHFISTWAYEFDSMPLQKVIQTYSLSNCRSFK